MRLTLWIELGNKPTKGKSRHVDSVVACVCEDSLDNKFAICDLVFLATLCVLCFTWFDPIIWWNIRHCEEWIVYFRCVLIVRLAHVKECSVLMRLSSENRRQIQCGVLSDLEEYHTDCWAIRWLNVELGYIKQHTWQINLSNNPLIALIFAHFSEYHRKLFSCFWRPKIRQFKKAFRNLQPPDFFGKEKFKFKCQEYFINCLMALSPFSHDINFNFNLSNILVKQRFQQPQGTQKCSTKLSLVVSMSKKILFGNLITNDLFSLVHSYSISWNASPLQLSHK